MTGKGRGWLLREREEDGYDGKRRRMVITREGKGWL
jgi:hypothetical protein